MPRGSRPTAEDILEHNARFASAAIERGFLTPEQILEVMGSEEMKGGMAIEAVIQERAWLGASQIAEIHKELGLPAPMSAAAPERPSEPSPTKLRCSACGVKLKIRNYSPEKKYNCPKCKAVLPPPVPEKREPVKAPPKKATSAIPSGIAPASGGNGGPDSEMIPTPQPGPAPSTFAKSSPREPDIPVVPLFTGAEDESSNPTHAEVRNFAVPPETPSRPEEVSSEPPPDAELPGTAVSDLPAGTVPPPVPEARRLPEESVLPPLEAVRTPPESSETEDAPSLSELVNASETVASPETGSEEPESSRAPLPSTEEPLENSEEGEPSTGVTTEPHGPAAEQAAFQSSLAETLAQAGSPGSEIPTVAEPGSPEVPPSPPEPPLEAEPASPLSPAEFESSSGPRPVAMTQQMPRRRTSGMLVALLLLALLGLAVWYFGPVLVKEYFVYKAQSAAELGDYQEAVEYYRQAREWGSEDQDLRLREEECEKKLKEPK